ncbi:MAG: AI-2E family transporter [Clostridiaceae bacterium]
MTFKTQRNIIALTGLMLLLVLYFADAVNMLKYLYGIIFPLLLGAGIAYVLNILVMVYEKIYYPNSTDKMIINSRKGVCVLFAVLSIALFLYLFLRLIIPQVAESMRMVSVQFPALYERVLLWIKQNSDQLPAIKGFLENINMDGQTIIKKAVELMGQWAGGMVSIVGTVFGTVANIIMAMIFSIYILIDKDNLKRKFDKLFRAYLKEGDREKLYDTLETANETFSKYIGGQCIEAIIFGSLCTAGMLILQFPYATMIGSVIGLTALIPILGAYFGAVVGFLLIVMIDPLKAVLFLAFIVILQQVEGNLIYPKVVGSSIGLPGIWVFAAIIVGGGLMGIAGVLLGVPVAATAYKLLGKAVNARLGSEKYEVQNEE